MKIVLDTNVVVSGLLNTHGKPGAILQMVAIRALIICYDARIITEYREVLLRPKFPINETEVDAILEHIEASGHLVATSPLPQHLPDPDDEPFLEVALAGGAEYLVTGNVKHYPEDRRRGVKVESPAEFVELYRKSIDDG
ncbi:MAG: putative toxin-antitoxin system toxin component, PIN family [Candidatus Neomarinimicrobiota bacterium]